jgi:hypothetical protein
LTAIRRRGNGGEKNQNLKLIIMKKIILLFFVVIIAGFVTPTKVDAKPFWIKFKLGIFAKWSITFNGNCDDGKGLCLAFGGTAAPGANPNLFGYDDELDKFFIKVDKKWSSAKSFSKETFEIEEDSPVDPKLIRDFPNFKYQTKNVLIKAGTYPVRDEGEFYIMAVDYILQ